MSYIVFLSTKGLQMVQGNVSKNNIHISSYKEFEFVEGTMLDGNILDDQPIRDVLLDLKKENVDLGGINVSKQYYSNPSRDNDYQWDHVGVNYVFPKEDTNYSIEVHYFTTYDYHNKTYTKELDDRIEDMIGNIHNKEYNGFISGINKIYNYLFPN